MAKSSSNMSSFFENVKQIGIAVVLAMLIKTSVVEAYKIPSASMEDTLLIGDFLLANKFKYGAPIPLTDWRLPAIREPERGDVIIFLTPKDRVTKYIKRCVAVGGDTVEIKNKVLYVNGEEIKVPDHAKHVEPTIIPRGQGGRNSRDNYGPKEVKPDHFFMMGDNRDNSYDSRYWGEVPKELILGEAMAVHWSWCEDCNPSPDVSLEDPLSVHRMFLYNAIHFFEKVRWDRLFGPIS